jgi:hypothetical protein
VSLCITIIVGASNSFTIVRLPIHSSEQKLLQFGWLAPDFDPQMYLARPYRKRGQVSQYPVEMQCCGNKVDGGKKEHNGYC